MSSPDCPPWDYWAFPNARDLIKARAVEALRDLRRGTLDPVAIAIDSRPVHERLFASLTPPGVPYYAGHYRGELFRCLRYREVQVQGDPMVGAPASEVEHLIHQLGSSIEGSIAGMEEGMTLPLSVHSAGERLAFLVAVASSLFVHLLTIHPYLNGNGHAARFVLWGILGRFGYWPARFPVEPRPAEPSYLEMIARHRRGDPEPLESFILRSLRPIRRGTA